jgi:CheY-like chemotaxis protein
MPMGTPAGVAHSEIVNPNRYDRTNVRVLIADDNREVRSALRLVLGELYEQRDDRGGMEAVATDEPTTARCTIAEAGNAAETLAQLESQEIDVLLLDWELPGLVASPLLERIKAESPQCAVIAMSGNPEARNLALLLGADYFIGKSDPPNRLLELLRGL